MYSIGSLPRKKADSSLCARWCRWLALLVVLWTVATWYVETRMERFVMSASNLVEDGDFDAGLPGTPNWEYGGLSGEIWEAGAGVEGTGALRLGGNSTPFLNYRMGSAWHADGYFTGLCLRGDQEAGEALRSVRAQVVFRRADLPQLRAPATEITDIEINDRWHCALQAVTVPFGLDELQIEIEASPGPGLVWVDQVALYPAVHPPLYRMLHLALVVGWVVLGVGSLAAVFHILGKGPGILAVVPAAIVLILVVVGTQDLAAISSRLAPAMGAIDDLAKAVFEAMRIFTGDRTWRTVGEFHPVHTFSMIITGIFMAWAVMLRFRWSERPWARAVWCGVVFGIAVQGIRLLVHAPTYASVNWLLDPLALAMGITVGALVFELLLRPRIPPLPPE